MSAQLLRELLTQFDGNYGLAAAAYNAGPRRVQNWLKGRKLPHETRQYVQIITGQSAEYWRKQAALNEFRAPKETGCPVLMSRLEKGENGKVSYADVAPIPLPRSRPDGDESVESAVVVASADVEQAAPSRSKALDARAAVAAAPKGEASSSNRRVRARGHIAKRGGNVKLAELPRYKRSLQVTGRMAAQMRARVNLGPVVAIAAPEQGRKLAAKSKRTQVAQSKANSSKRIRVASLRR
jgi:hypothetical protein